MTNKEKLNKVQVKEAAVMLDEWFELKPEIENAYCERCRSYHHGCPFGDDGDGCNVSSADIILELLLQKYSGE